MKHPSWRVECVWCSRFWIVLIDTHRAATITTSKSAPNSMQKWETQKSSWRCCSTRPRTNHMLVNNCSVSFTWRTLRLKTKIKITGTVIEANRFHFRQSRVNNLPEDYSSRNMISQYIKIFLDTIRIGSMTRSQIRVIMHNWLQSSSRWRHTEIKKKIYTPSDLRMNYLWFSNTLRSIRTLPRSLNLKLHILQWVETDV